MIHRLSLATRNALGLALCATALTGCHLDMWNQRRYEPMERGVSFGPGQSSARPFVEGTVPYQMAKLDDHYYTARVNGELVSTLPAQITLSRELLERGQARFQIYCMPCHGETGHGNGMIVQRGFPQPTSYMDQRLLEAPIGYFFDVMSNGFGRMYGYASRVPVEDRWAIAAYVRTLQLSQNATPDMLPPDVLTQAREPRPGDEAGDTPAGGVAHD